MLLQKEKLQHINSIAHEGKVVVIATDADGKIWYAVKQDGFEDSYLNTPEAQRTGWENWQELELPNQEDDQSVIDKETKELTYQSDISKFILKSRYKTQTESAVAPVQVVSGLGHLYIFRQSNSYTLLVDRFILDGLTNKLTRKLEVRFKRSKQKHKPSQNMKKGTSGLANIDSLDFRDINGNNFYEPTTELCLVDNLHNGWFSVVLVPTNEQDKFRWHIFAYNSQTQKVELTTIRASDDALFDVKDYTVLEPKPNDEETLIPRSIPGIIKRTLDLVSVSVGNGLAATKYDIQRERQTDDGMQLLRESTRVMLTIPTNQGNVAAISFAVAGDGTLSQINDTPTQDIVRSNSRQILLPLNTLDEIIAIGTTTPPPQGAIKGMERGDSDKILITSDHASQLKEGAVVKIAQTRNYDGHYHAWKIDENTFEIDATWVTSEIGTWEEVPPKETGLVFNGMITAVKRMADGKLQVTAFNHDLSNGDEVQIVNTTAYNSSYPVTKIAPQSFIIDGILWKAGEAVNLKLESRKRRGIVFDGNDDKITIPDGVLKAPSASENFEATCSAWIYQSAAGSTEQLIVGQKSGSMELLINKSGKVAFRVGSDGSYEVEDSNPLPRGEWVHYAGVVCKKNSQSTTLILYKNGAEAVKKDFVGYDDLELQGTLDVESAYIFQRDEAGKWQQIKTLQPSSNERDEKFGCSVAISEDTAIVGGYDRRLRDRRDYRSVGAAYIFQRDEAGNWKEMTTLLPSDPIAGLWFGYSVAISGDTAIVGACIKYPDANNSWDKKGAVYIFQSVRSEGLKSGQKLQPTDSQRYDRFGYSVAISGETAIIGAPGAYADSNNVGRAYIFQRDEAGKWQQIKTLQASDQQTDDKFGYCVAISGNTVIVGAQGKDTHGSNTCSAYIFTLANGEWEYIKKLQASAQQTDDKFGCPSAISGDTVIVGAKREDTDGRNAGSAYIFNLLNGSWISQKDLKSAIGQSFVGKIADVQIWNKARTAQEIKDSMYLQLTGQEIGLVGYWRLGAIVEGDQRQVLDFSVNENHGIVHGEAYVSDVTLIRDLQPGIPATKYENEELFAVSEIATYEEEFEFKTNLNVNPDNVDDKNGKIFAIAYKGKKSRGSEHWIEISDNVTEFSSLTNNWYKAKSRFTVPDGVSVLRSFGIHQVQGKWSELDIRKHRIRLVSDSITEAKYSDSVTNLSILVDSQQQLETNLKQLGEKELEEGILLQEKQELDALIAAASNQTQTQTQINSLMSIIRSLESEEQSLNTTYQNERNKPFNYVCYLYNIAKGDNDRVHAFGHQSYNLQIKPNENNSDEQKWQKWKFVDAGVGHYFIYNIAKGDNQRVHAFGHQSYNLQLKPNENNSDEQKWQKWKLVKTNETTNTKIQDAEKAWQDKREKLQGKKNELAILNQTLNVGEAQKNVWKMRLNQVINIELKQVQTDLNELNTAFINGVENTQQTPQTMPTLTDSKGLVTQGALLGFVRPASRLSAIETCEGNVQLSYFDNQGRMRQTNFDATSDSRNANVEQWLPDAQRVCLKIAENNHVVKLENPIYLGNEWTIEAWFSYPLPQLPQQNWNTLTGNQDGSDRQIVVKDGEQLGTYYGGKFHDSGYNIKLLSNGWHHLTAVAKGDTTLFYIDGKKVGDVKQKAIEAQTTDAGKKELEKQIFKSSSPISTIGNTQANSQQFGKLAEVRIWEVALSEEEIAVNSKTLLSGNEPGLRAYYPMNEATGTTVRDSTGNERNHGTIVSASWWGCAAPIGNAGHQVVQFDGVDDSITTTTKNLMNDLSAFTLEGWVKAASVPDANISLFGQNDVVEFSLSSKKLSLWTKKGGNLVADNPFVSNSWHHVAAIGDGKNLFLYIDGTQIKTQGSVTQNYGDSVSSFQIGGLDFSASGTNNQFQGQIAEVRIWKVARTQTEIQANMHKRLTDKEQNLVGYWPLNKIKPEGTANTVNKVSDLAGNHHGTVTGAIITDDNTLPIVSDAVVSTEYSTVTLDAVTKQKSAIMRRFFASGTLNGVNLLPDKRIETLELNWIGNAQFAPTLLGYIEGAPPIPSENLTEEDDYNGATSVEITMSEDVEFSWRRSQDNGLGASADTFAGANVEITAGLGVETKIADIRAGFKGNLDTSNQFQNESSIASGSSVSMSDKLELRGTVEQDAHFPHLGKRFIPKNVGYALVVSALADVFITRLARSRKMIGYQVQPVENIPPDVNTITFLINPAYVMKGSLDGMTGSRATSDRFFKHVPEMRSQYGSLYPASYYRLQEAYDLKQQIEQQDKQREAYFAQYNALLVDETSLDREVNSGAAPTGISVSREEDKPEGMSDSDWEKEQKRRQNEQLDNIEQQTKKDQDKQSEAEQQKRAEIEAKIKDQEKRTQATASFAGWQKKMEDIQIRAGKRNIVNTYVWDADGGLRTESQSFASTAEHTIGGSFTMNAGLGFEGDFAAGGVGAELTAQATVNMTQTMNKTETRSKGLQLNVDLSGVESKGVTDHNDYPILPGEKVDRYRFMSFYLEGSTNNFFDFFNYVVDPEWLASNDEEARALRQVEAGKPNKAWRVMHRVTYVERPALMGFGRSINQVKNLSELEVKHQDLLDKFKKLATEQQELKSKLDQILQALERRTQNS